MKVRTLAVTIAAFLSAVAIILTAAILFKFLFPDVPAPVPSSDIIGCRRSVDRGHVVDEKGRVCKWEEVNYKKTGCCPDDNTDGCLQCKDNCCSVYAYCISCCLQPKYPIQPNFSNPEMNIDKFDYCRGVCRTNSRSVVNENQWKSELKYCFPYQNIYLSSQSVPLEEEDGDVESMGNFISEQNKVGDLRAKPRLGEESGDKGKINESGGKINEISEEDVILDRTPENNVKNDLENDVDVIENLLEKVDEKMKKLIEENEHLTEENQNLVKEIKILADKLEKLEAQKKEKGLFESTREKKEKNGSDRVIMNGFLILFLLILGYMYMGV